MPRTKRPPKLLVELLAEYVTFPDDQPVTESYAAARLGYSKPWCQLKRIAGGGPKFHRTATGKIFYRKGDIEAFLADDLKPFDSTSQYPETA